ncbi:MAG: acetyltransferase [Pseudomonadota bacterium]|nr:acetyltransferase [Pseudomonadota bacterium]
MIHLIGTGGHGKVVLDALLLAGIPLAGVTARDGRADLSGRPWMGLPIQTPEISEPMRGHDFHVAIGDCAARERLTQQASTAGARALTVVHPDASVSPFATLAGGVFVAARAVVGPDAGLEQGVIVNHGAVVDHDCRIGAFTHVAPNSSLGGGVRVGARCLIGAGAVVLPGVTIGDDVVIGAGAVVTRDVASHQTWVGVPAAPKGVS